MKPVPVVLGLVLVGLGIVAVATNDFAIASGWLVAGALALMGLAGLGSALRTQRSD